MNSDNKMLKIIPYFCLTLCIASIVLSVYFKITYRIYDVYPMLVTVVMLFVLSSAFVLHEKNAMKAALSAVLTVLLCWELFYLVDTVNFLFLTEDSEPEFYDWFSFAVQIATSVLFTVILTYHFLMTAEHKSNPRRVMINTGALMLIVLLFIVLLGFDVVRLLAAVPGKKWWGNKLTIVAMKLLEIAALFEIVRIERLLDMFRNRREEKAKIKGD